jgi:hypothetical protein
LKTSCSAWCKAPATCSMSVVCRMPSDHGPARRAAHRGCAQAERRGRPSASGVARRGRPGIKDSVKPSLAQAPTNTLRGPERRKRNEHHLTTREHQPHHQQQEALTPPPRSKRKRKRRRHGR